MSQVRLHKNTLDLIRQTYGCQVKRFRLFSSGTRNQNLLLWTDKGPRVLRIFLHKTLPETALERSMLSELAALNLPVPTLYPTLQGKEAVHLNGHPSLLLSCLPGQQVKHPTPQLMKELGDFLGRLHRHFLNRRPPAACRRTWEPSALLRLIPRWKTILRQKNYPHADELLAFIQAEIKECQFPTTLPHGFTHQDLKPENTLVRHGHVSGVLDFDNAYAGAFLHDITTSLLWWCHTRDKFNQTAADNFLQAYDAVRPLTKKENELVLSDGLRFRFLREMFIWPMRVWHDPRTAGKHVKRFYRLYHQKFKKRA